MIKGNIAASIKTIFIKRFIGLWSRILIGSPNLLKSLIGKGQTQDGYR